MCDICGMAEGSPCGICHKKICKDCRAEHRMTHNAKRAKGSKGGLSWTPSHVASKARVGF